MKSPVLLAFLAGVCFLPSTGRSQFYAPDTEYHDPVQRLFVVEAARVLAWWMDPSGTNLAEVTYSTTTKPDQSTVWEIRWLSGKGAPVKVGTISYDAAVLKQGPEFYRAVFKELWLKDWKNPPSLDIHETTEAFWRGAARMGVSREASLQAAQELIRGRDKTPERKWMPELAGLLTHASLPGYGVMTTLDRVILARGAAWLAFAEYLTSARLDALWAPVLFQAGRERPAAQLWQASVPTKMEQATSQQEGWNMWLRQPSSKDVFLFATGSNNVAMAMPMLAYDARVNGSGKTLAELMPIIVGSPGQLAALHNYAPLFATSTSISGGRILEGAWPVYSRRAWLDLLSAWSPAANDYSSYLKTLGEATNAVRKALEERPETDPSLVGVRELAPLLALAHTEGVGKLVPTPVATARDLLNYGWEQTGWQMGARYSFVRFRWGVPELAEPIYKIVTGNAEGLMPFFSRERDAKIQNYRECLKRLQLVEGLCHLVGFSTPPTDSDDETLEGARLFVKRAWMRPLDFDWQARALWDMNAITNIPELILSLHEQGGCFAASEALGYLAPLKREALRQVPQGAQLKYSLAESLPQPTVLKVKAMFDEKFRDMDNFSRGQEYERLYWQNPDAGLEGRVIHNYLASASFKSARRFYSQARANFEDPVAFSSGAGAELFVAGYCIDDAELRKQAMEDSSSGSYVDMAMHLWEAAIHDQSTELANGVNELVERYEDAKGADAPAKRLRKFLPLLPALRDPTHASRREALEFFGKDGSWTILRFIWIEKFKLPVQDAIVLLGGRENSPLNQVIIAYLEKDQRKALGALNQLIAAGSTRGEQDVLALCLYNRLHPVSPPHEEPDLKPAGATTIRQAVLEKLKSSGRLKE
jgi:hypothetical protein